MSTFLREPNPGDRISANLIRDIVRAIKELRPIAGHGMKLKRGPNGTTFNATVPPPAPGAASSSDLGCFAIKSITSKNEEHGDAAGETHRGTFDISFVNRYYRVGGMTYEASGDLPTVTAPCVVYLKIDMADESPSSELTSAETVGKMRSDERNPQYYVIPLYAFDGNGSVVTDFRNAPSAAAFEFDPGEEDDAQEESK